MVPVVAAVVVVDVVGLAVVVAVVVVVVVGVSAVVVSDAEVEGTVPRPASWEGAGSRPGGKMCIRDSLWPWTYNQEKPFKEQYGWGVAGLTTDSPEYAADMITSLEVVIDGGNGVPMKAGDTAAYTLNGVMQAGAKKDVTGSASVSMLDGDGVVSLTDGVLKAEREGTASFLLTYTVDALSLIHIYQLRVL